jgi:hypothetical protein
MEIAPNFEDNKVARQHCVAGHLNPDPALFFCGNRKGYPHLFVGEVDKTAAIKGVRPPPPILVGFTQDIN